MTPVENALREFARANRMDTKGALCVALVVTRHAKENGLPLDPDVLLTKGGGQVAGLGKDAVQSILAEHDIQRTLAEEGGRTSRGSIGNMRKYAAFLNDLSSKRTIDLDEIEQWWIGRVNEFFAGKPFILRFDPSKSLRVIMRDLLTQAQKRQEDSTGSMFAGSVLQHLVGAKMELLLGHSIAHHGASVADAVSGRDADFLIEDVAIHVTTTPAEALIRKCSRNIERGLRPLIITTHKGSLVAEELAHQAKIADRLDIFEAEQFLAGNLYEIGKFAEAGRKTTAGKLIEKYNEIITACETDPGLRIEIGK